MGVLEGGRKQNSRIPSSGTHSALNMYIHIYIQTHTHTFLKPKPQCNGRVSLKEAVLSCPFLLAIDCPHSQRMNQLIGNLAESVFSWCVGEGERQAWGFCLFTWLICCCRHCFISLLYRFVIPWEQFSYLIHSVTL